MLATLGWALKRTLNVKPQLHRLGTSAGSKPGGCSYQFIASDACKQELAQGAAQLQPQWLKSSLRGGVQGFATKPHPAGAHVQPAKKRLLLRLAGLPIAAGGATAMYLLSGRQAKCISLLEL
jgi:hypothetical protein